MVSAGSFLWSEHEEDGAAHVEASAGVPDYSQLTGMLKDWRGSGMGEVQPCLRSSYDC